MDKAAADVPPGSVPRSVNGHSQAWLRLDTLKDEPTISPLLLMPKARLVVPPKLPRSVITPLVYDIPCKWPAAVNEYPATMPVLLIASALLIDPPRVPRSVITPPPKRNACSLVCPLE